MPPHTASATALRRAARWGKVMEAFAGRPRPCKAHEFEALGSRARTGPTGTGGGRCPSGQPWPRSHQRCSPYHNIVVPRMVFHIAPAPDLTKVRRHSHTRIWGFSAPGGTAGCPPKPYA